MKLPYLLFILFFSFNFIQAQSVELVFDSLYQERYAGIFNGDDRPNITTNSIIYDELERPLRYRNTFQLPDDNKSISLFDVSYVEDSVFTLRTYYSYLDSAFLNSTRTHLYTLDQNREIIFTDLYSEDMWNPSRRNEYQFNENGDLLQLDYYVWDLDNYKYAGKQVNEYNDDYFRTAQYWYLINDQNIEFLDRQRKWVLDEDNNVINFKSWKFTGDSLFLDSQNEFIYEDQLLQESLISFYTATDTFQTREEYFYESDERYDGYSYRKNSDDVWLLESKTSFYESAKEIGDEIDSLFIFVYDLAEDTLNIQSRFYYSYPEPEPNHIVFIESRESFDSDSEQWLKTNYQEEYFHYNSPPSSTVELEKESFPVVVYPNPSSDFIYFNLMEKKVSKIVISNQLGETVLQLEKDLSVLRVTDFPPGIYYILLEANGESFTTKFIKS